jgi:hypothetical protein
MGRDVAPVITARVLLAHGVRDDVVSAYVASMWALNDVDVRAAVAAAHVLLRRVQTAGPPSGDEFGPQPRTEARRARRSPDGSSGVR